MRCGDHRPTADQRTLDSTGRGLGIEVDDALELAGQTDIRPASALRSYSVERDFAKKGDVIVIAAKNDETAAVIGDRWALWAKKVGVAGIVCDGLVRDVIGLLDVDIPVFARGLSPNSGFKHGPGEINTRVSCGGIAVDPGDIVDGDGDGVVVVPRGEAEHVAARLAEVRKKEAALDAAVRRAISMQFWNEAETQARGGVRYLD